MSNKKESSLEYTLKYVKESRKRSAQREKETREKRMATLGQPIQPERSWQERMYVDSDKPGTMDNGTATLWYIIVMVIGAFFNARLAIWIVATVVWLMHIKRKSIRQIEWDNKHNGGKK